MPRYVIERNFGTISDEDMLAASALSDELISARFPEIVWEHSHIVATDDGEIVTFCIYAAPSEEMIREHAERSALTRSRTSTSSWTTSRRQKSAAGPLQRSPSAAQLSQRTCVSRA